MAGRRDLLVLLAILVLAALLRLPGIDQRGRWDADQGHDMLVLHGLVTRGEVPLLGPPTSIGTFHHGALYYYLLAPAAAVSGADPVAVTAWIALIGIAAVAATWWLARMIGGPVAALVAGVLAAVSPAGIDESTFIWNPNLIPLAAAVTFGAAIRAWQTRRPAWWLMAAAGAMAVSQLHVLGIVVLPPLAIAYLADLRRRSRQSGEPVRPLVLAGLGALAIVAAGYLPLVVHELTHDFAEARALADYVAGGGRSSETGLAGRLSIIALRSVAWPLAGLLTDRPVASLVAIVLAGALASVALVVRAPGRWAVAWLLATFAWSVGGLSVLAPSLATITPGLPNDHYHAFLDPLVVALAGVGLARLSMMGLARVAAMGAGRLSAMGAGRVPAMAGRAAAAAALVVLVAIGVVGWPPASSPDGGWPLAEAAAVRVEATMQSLTTRPQLHTELAGIPEFKSSDAMGFPLTRRGIVTWAPGTPEAGVVDQLVLVCDPLFEDVVGADCGGPAEGAWLAPGLRPRRLVDRFDAGPRRIVSVYAIGEEQ